MKQQRPIDDDLAGADAEHASLHGLAVVRKMSDVRREPVKWTWPSYIVAAALNVFGGDPGTAKTFLMLYLVALASTGRPWPDGCSSGGPMDVVLLCAEDSAEMTLRPRLEDHGANLDRVHIIDQIKDEQGKPHFPCLSNAWDMQVVEHEVTRTEAGILLIDPANAYVDPKLDVRMGNGVRGITTPLAAMAQRTGVAVVVIMHLNKAQMQSAMYRMSGSVDWVAAARSVMAIGFDPTRTDRRRLLLPVKCNLCAPPNGIAYNIDADGILTVDNDPITVGPEEMLRGITEGSSSGNDTKLQEAQEFLKAFLANGKRPALDALQEADKERHIKQRTLNKAKKELGVKSEKILGVWYWSLPPQAAQSASAEEQGCKETPTHATLQSCNLATLDASDMTDHNKPVSNGDSRMQGCKDARLHVLGEPCNLDSAPINEAKRCPGCGTTIHFSEDRCQACMLEHYSALVGGGW